MKVLYLEEQEVKEVTRALHIARNQAHIHGYKEIRRDMSKALDIILKQTMKRG